MGIIPLRKCQPIRGSLKDPNETVFLRIFFHVHGDKIVLLLGGYDKGADPSKSRQQAEIKTARSRLREFKERARNKRRT